MEDCLMSAITQRRPDGSFLISNGLYHIPNEGEWVEQWAELNAQWETHPEQFEQLAEPEPVLPTLEEAKAAKLVEINMACQRALEALTPTYPERELTTFDKQEQEARAWLKDDTSPTPFLSALAAGRGIELSVLVDKVIAKADAFAVASGFIIGQRQALEDRLDACETAEEVEAVAVTFAMPHGESVA